MLGSQILPVLAGGFSVLAGTALATPSTVARDISDAVSEATNALQARSVGADLALGCAALKLVFGDKLFYPNDSVYKYEQTQFWSNTEVMSPTCIFRPTNAVEVSAAVLANRLTQTPWAVRGGGHMGIKGANSIDKGMLMVMSNITTLQVSSDRKTVAVGPSNRWNKVYRYLSQYNLTAAGGRLGPVGVPGLLLAGGVSYLGNQVGWASDNVVSYEVVLASGSIVTVSATCNSDLFWALKGGSNNFGIVTKFTINTFPSTKVYAGVYTVTSEYAEPFKAALANFSASNTDPLSHLVPLVIPAEDPASTLYSTILFYDSPTNDAPACFKQFFDIPAVASTMAFKTVADFADETGALVVDHINDVFVAGTTVGKDYDSQMKGVNITNSIYLDAMPALYKAVGGADKIVLSSISWQPLGALWMAGAAKQNPNGSALVLDVAGKGTHLAWAIAVEWVDGDGLNDAVEAWVKSTTAAIEAATKAAGIYDPFKYMGDAAGFQEIYPGYGTKNQQKLLDISRKYDGDRAFQNFWPGGFKIGA